MLGRGIRSHSRCALDPGSGRHVDDFAPAGGQHRRNLVLHRQEHSNEIGRDCLLEFSESELGQWPRHVARAGVVERDVQVPNVATVRFTISSTWRSSVTSVGMASAAPPDFLISSSSDSISLTVRAATTTVAPAFAKPRAAAAPMPRPAPATIATFPGSETTALFSPRLRGLCLFK